MRRHSPSTNVHEQERCTHGRAGGQNMSGDMLSRSGEKLEIVRRETEGSHGAEHARVTLSSLRGHAAGQIQARSCVSVREVCSAPHTWPAGCQARDVDARLGLVRTGVLGAQSYFILIQRALQ